MAVCVQNRFPDYYKSEEAMETHAHTYKEPARRASVSGSTQQGSRHWMAVNGIRRGPPPETLAQAQALLARLTDREHQVMGFIVRGISNKVIASEMGVSQRTIEAHRRRIFLKMHVRNAVQLVACLSGGVRAA